MSLFAASYVLTLELPGLGYVVSLAIGVGVGLCAIFVGKLAFGRKKPNPSKNPGPDSKRAEPVHDPFTEGSPSELRKSMRREGNPTEIFLAKPDNKNKPSRGWVLDRSLGGLYIAVGEEFKPGTKLAVLPANAPPMTPWVDIEVRSCRELKEGYGLGCQFLKTPNWSVLLMFG